MVERQQKPKAAAKAKRAPAKVKARSKLLDEFPTLAAYVARGEARPAYKRAFAAQAAINTRKAPAG
jgi:glutathione S-transferase